MSVAAKIRKIKIRTFFFFHFLFPFWLENNGEKRKIIIFFLIKLFYFAEWKRGEKMSQSTIIEVKHNKWFVVFEWKDSVYVCQILKVTARFHFRQGDGKGLSMTETVWQNDSTPRRAATSSLWVDPLKDRES